MATESPPAHQPVDNDDLSDWWIRVRPLRSDVPAHVRVKRWLKSGLRGFKLRCEAIRASPPKEERAK